MLILVLAIAVVLLFILGVSFVYRGYNASPDLTAVVSADEVEKIKGELGGAREQEEQLKLQLDTMAVKMEETKAQLQDAENSKQELARLQALEQQQRQQLAGLEKDLVFVRGKADNLSQRAVEAIDAIRKDNEQLKAAVKDADNKVDPEDVARLNEANQSLKGQIKENQDKLAELQQLLDAEKSRTEQSHTESQRAIQDLAAENEKLKSGIVSITQKIRSVDETWDLSQLTPEQIGQHADQASEELHQAQARIDALREQLQRLQEEKTSSDQRTEEMQSRLREALTQGAVVPEHSPEEAGPPNEAVLQLAREKEDLERSLRQMRDFNQQLLEKEQRLLFELTKSRTQAMGLDRICQGFRQEIQKHIAPQ